MCHLTTDMQEIKYLKYRHIQRIVLKLTGPNPNLTYNYLFYVTAYVILIQNPDMFFL